MCNSGWKIWTPFVNLELCLQCSPQPLPPPHPPPRWRRHFTDSAVLPLKLHLITIYCSYVTLKCVKQLQSCQVWGIQLYTLFEWKKIPTHCHLLRFMVMWWTPVKNWHIQFDGRWSFEDSQRRSNPPCDWWTLSNDWKKANIQDYKYFTLFWLTYLVLWESIRTSAVYLYFENNLFLKFCLIPCIESSITKGPPKDSSSWMFVCPPSNRMRYLWIDIHHITVNLVICLYGIIFRVSFAF